MRWLRVSRDTAAKAVYALTTKRTFYVTSSTANVMFRHVDGTFPSEVKVLIIRLLSNCI